MEQDTTSPEAFYRRLKGRVNGPIFAVLTRLPVYTRQTDPEVQAYLCQIASLEIRGLLWYFVHNLPETAWDLDLCARAMRRKASDVIRALDQLVTYATIPETATAERKRYQRGHKLLMRHFGNYLGGPVEKALAGTAKAA